jgi:branched-chain amino acid transport system permease protein
MEIPGFWDFIQLTFGIGWMADVPMISLKYTWIYVAYFVIMLISPRGLFGWKQ